MHAFRQIISKIKSFQHYNTDQKGIIKRFFDEGDNWNLHLKNTKEYILKSFPNNNKSIAILGSGWLLDVPVDDVLKRTEKLILIDISHPKQILNRYKDNKQIIFIKADLTNNMIVGVQKSKTFIDFLKLAEKLKPIDYLNKYSFVVSLNLLNQLDILLCDLLKKKFKVADVDLLPIRAKIQTLHLQSLPVQKSCIITDYCEVSYNNNLKDSFEKSLIHTDLSCIKDRQEWIWTFDTKKTYKPKAKTNFKVLAGIL